MQTQFLSLQVYNVNKECWRRKQLYTEVKEVAQDGKAGQQKNQLYIAVFHNRVLLFSAAPELVRMLTPV